MQRINIRYYVKLPSVQTVFNQGLANYVAHCWGKLELEEPNYR